MSRVSSKWSFHLINGLNKLYTPFHILSHELGTRAFLRKLSYDYQPRKEDIFIVSYPKSGTTWVQEILFQLVTDGDLEKIPHMSVISPHLEEPKPLLNPPLGMMPNPRLIKTHLNYDYIPKGPGKYIYIVRNGLDVAVSYYHQHVSYKMYRGTFEQFLPTFLKGQVAYGSWYDHVAQWVKHRNDLDLLWLSYEDLLEDLPREIRKIADFCGIPIQEQEFPRIVERSGFKFMKANYLKFDMAQEILLSLGLKFDNFIRKGEGGEWKSTFTPAQLHDYQVKFDKHLKGKGLDHYRNERQELTSLEEETQMTMG